MDYLLCDPCNHTETDSWCQPSSFSSHTRCVLSFLSFLPLLKAVLFSFFVVLLVIAILFLKQDCESLEPKVLYRVKGVCMSGDSPLPSTDGPECIPLPFSRLIACDI